MRLRKTDSGAADCRRDMLRHTVPSTSCGDRKGSGADIVIPHVHCENKVR